MKPLRCITFVFLLLGLSVSSVFAGASIHLTHPPNAIVGSSFQVTVSIQGDGNPAVICGYQYRLLYDTNLLELIDQEGIPFFSTPLLPGYPDLWSPLSSAPYTTSPGDIGAVAVSGSASGDSLPTDTSGQTATFTFRAKKEGTAVFILNPGKNNFVGDCASNPNSTDFSVVSNPSILLKKTASIPTLSEYGLMLLALLLVLSAVVTLRKKSVPK